MNPKTTRRSPLTGEVYPQCHCGRTAYEQGLCYAHFQDRDKNPAAVSLGRLGGLRRAQTMTPEARQEQASKASNARTVRKGWPLGRPSPMKGVTRGPYKPRRAKEG